MKQKAPHPNPLPKGEGAGCAASIAPQGEARQHDPLTEATVATRLRSIPAGVWTLGFVSMLMDISSEMIHALLPIYMVSVLGTSTLAVGLIEGIAEATAAITKIFSGALSDWLGRRKELAALGYGLGGVHKARVSARAEPILARRRPLCGPDRQRHPRRPARRARRRSLPA